MTPYIMLDVVVGCVFGILLCGCFYVVCLAVESWKEVKIERLRLEAFSKIPAPQVTILKQEESDESDWWKRGSE